MKTVTMRRIAILLVALGVISVSVGVFVIWIFSGPYSLWIFSADYSQCRFTQSAGCQVVAKAPSWGLIVIAIGALLYTSARTRKAGVVGKEA